MVIKLADLPKVKKPFKFLDFRADHPEFLNLVARVWNEEMEGSPMYRLCSKIRRLKEELRRLNKNHFSKISSRVVQARAELNRIQGAVQQQPLDSTLCREEARLVKVYADLSRAEESFLKQKSRPSFFFSAVKSHHARSKIVSITKEDGSRIEDPNAIKEEAIQYFQRLLSENQPRPTLDYDLLGRALPRKLENSQCGELAREVTNEEIKDAIFSLKDSKAPGPDGSMLF